MHTFEEIFAPISTGRILDVATGTGGFIRTMVGCLQGFDEIVGIDTNERHTATFAEAVAQMSADQPVRFVTMDAARMDFPDGSFDMVSIANSLHHMADLEAVLAQMKRVLRPGGYFVICEMYRDGQTESQLTHVLLHHWWAAVDTAQGITHHETYPRQAIVDIVQGLGLSHWDFYDIAYLNNDPKDPELLQYLDGVIDQYLQRAQGTAQGDVLQQRGEELRQRVQTLGFHSASSLVALGRQ